MHVLRGEKRVRVWPAGTCWDDVLGVRFEEVAVGYPWHWQHAKGWGDYLRAILPGAAEAPESGDGGPTWHR